MPAPPTRVRSPEEWRGRLKQQLAERQEPIALYKDYYKGAHRMSFATQKFKDAFGDLFTAFADNWCGLAVDIVVDRLAINGFRFSGSTTNDQEAWGIWQANRMDARSMKLHTTEVKTGWGYVIVGWDDDRDLPLYTVEDPSQVIVECDPADDSVRLAALKSYIDHRGDMIDVVYEPDRITTFRVPAFAAGIYQASPTFYLPSSVSVGGESAEQANPLGEVPVIPFENNPDLLEGGVSELRPAIKLQDAANKFFSDMIVASEFQAFRQRVLTGVEVPNDPKTGKPMTDIEMAVSRLMLFKAPDAKAFDLQQAPLENYINAIEMTVQHFSAQTRTPPHYLLAKLINLSGDALKAAESGLNWRALRKQIDNSDPWEDVQRLGFKWRYLKKQDEADKKRSEDMEVHTDWAPPETQALSVVADSISKKREAGWPLRTLLEESGMTAQEVSRVLLLIDEESAADGPDMETLEKVRFMHDELGVPYEILWKKYLGMSDAEIKKALEIGPLPRGGPQGGGRTGANGADPARPRDAASATPRR
jgi:hypothetical protein